MHAKFLEKKQVAKNTYSFFFEPSEDFRYNAGQFIELSIPELKLKNSHWFTISSSPTEKHIAITTKIPPNPSTYKAALSTLKVNNIIKISSPMGDFVLPINTDKPLIFIGIGIGITPFRSMIKYIQDKDESRNIKLIYSVNYAEDIAFDDIFSRIINYQKIVKNPPKNWPGLAGKITAKEIVKNIDDGQETFFLSGPEKFVEQITKDLINIGVEKRSIQTDYFLGYDNE